VTKRCIEIIAMIVAIGFADAVAQAQQRRARDPDAFIQQQRSIEREIQDNLDKKAPLTRKLDLDWGGWIGAYLFLWDDGINSSRTYRQTDLRVWGRLGLEGGAHQIYARGILSYKDFNSGDSYNGNDNDWEGMNLERGYYEFDLRNLIRYHEQREADYNVNFKIGRDLVEWGTGYTLSLMLDHVAITGEWHDVSVTGLFANTPGSLNDFDQTRAGWNDMDRNFLGVQVKYHGLKKHEPFFYALWQNDQNSSRYIFRPRQRFDYDSFYLGLGSRGELARNLLYSTEWVYEQGDSHSSNRTGRTDDIAAWAFDAQLRYTPQVKMRPSVLFEYMFASGDGDRIGSPTNTIGGNTRGNDKSFIGFGFRDTGLSFAPLLTNVHIWRAGGSFYPFEDVQALERMELGTDWFLYHKHHRDGAVSDITANVQSGYLGWEMDYFVNWKLASDVAWTVRYGLFFPGSAFSDQTTRTFLLTGVSWNF